MATLGEIMAAKGQKFPKIDDDEDVIADAPSKVADDSTIEDTPQTVAPPEDKPSVDESGLASLRQSMEQAGRDADADVMFRRASAAASLGRQNPDQIDVRDIEARRNQPLEMYKQRQEAKKAAAQQALEAAHARYFNTEADYTPQKYQQELAKQKETEQYHRDEIAARNRATDVQEGSLRNDRDYRTAELAQRHQDKMDEIRERLAAARTEADRVRAQKDAENEIARFKDQGKAMDQLDAMEPYANGSKAIPKWDPLLLARENAAQESNPGWLNKASRAITPVEQSRSTEQNDYMANVYGARNELLHQAFGSHLTPTEIAQKAKEYHIDPQYSPEKRQKGIQQLMRDVQQELTTSSAKLNPQARETLEARGAKIYSPKGAANTATPAQPATKNIGGKEMYLDAQGNVRVRGG